MNDYYILEILYISFSLVSIFRLVFTLKKEKQVSIKIFTELLYIIILFVVPMIYIYKIMNNENVKYWSSYMIATPVFTKYVILILQVVAYIMLELGCNFPNKIKKKNKKNKESEFVNFENIEKKEIIAGYIILAIGWLCLLLWTKAYGSLFGIFKYATQIRAGIVYINNPWTFLKWFCQLLLISTLIFGKHFFITNGNISKKILYLILTLISTFGCYIYLIAHDGRNLIITFLVAIILNLIENKKINIKFLLSSIVIGILSIVLIANLNNITKFFRTDNKNIELDASINIFDTLVNEFGFTYMNINNALYRYENNELDYNVMDEVKSIATALIPERFKSDDVENLYQYNTKFYPLHKGTIPTDILTASIYLFGYLGVVGIPFVCGILINIIDRYFKNRIKSNYHRQIYYLTITILSLRICGYLDFSVIIFNFVFVYVAIIVYYFIRRLKADDKKNIL